VSDIYEAIYLIGFRGVGFKDPAYQSESPLIQAGHVGWYFAEESVIYGFHPTSETVADYGGMTALLKALKRHEIVAATVQDDSAIFERANELAKQGGTTNVWEQRIKIAQAEVNRMRELTQSWLSNQTVFRYTFPFNIMAHDQIDNCATFPRWLGLPLPHYNGQLIDYIPKLASYGQLWSPKKGSS
jgi:hypothetical protein